jgi:hypothetical protein
MPTQLHPAVDHVINGGKYVFRGRSEAFTEHEIKDAKGEVVRKVTRDDLERFAKTGNEKALAGALSPLGIGHTFDDIYDAKGQLVKKFSESQQPMPIGYLHDYSVELNPHTQKYSLFVNEYVQKQITDPETGRTVDGISYAASFPRRSAEVYHASGWLDWLAALRRAPRLDLSLQAYSNESPIKYYTPMPDGTQAPVCEMARGKFSMDTGGEMDDPTKPPSANPTPPASPATPPATGAATPPTAGGRQIKSIADNPMHQEAADAYSMHSFGMHPSRSKALMQHMHGKYAAECGMDGDMNAEYAMGAPSATSVMPGAAAPAPAATVPPKAGETEHKPPPMPPEHAKMQQDQANIEKDRYERRLIELETRAATAEAKELDGHMRYELQQMVAEGFDIDAAKQLEFMQTRKYSRQQVDDHVSILRGAAQKAPISRYEMPLDPESHTLQRPFGAPSDPQEKIKRDFDKVQRYMRARMGTKDQCSWEEACERYDKPNGSKITA